MDPNATLEAMRSLADDIQEEAGKVDANAELLASYAISLAEYTKAMDEWLTKQGFLPQRWSRNDRVVPSTRERIERLQTQSRLSRLERDSRR